MIEQWLRDLLLTFDAVTAIVGSGADARIRPDQLDEADKTPAILIELQTIDHMNTLDGLGGLAKAMIHVTCLSEQKAKARQLCEAVRTNNTDPGTGLAGYTGAAGDGYIDSATLERTTVGQRPLFEGGDELIWAVTGEYEVMYQEAT